MSHAINADPENEVSCGDNVDLRGTIKGRGNVVRIAGADHPSSITLNIIGNDNTIDIAQIYFARGLSIMCGSHARGHRTRLKIGPHFSCETNCRFMLHTSGNSLTIGDDCMFSSDIIVRCGESPHLIFDEETGAYLDQSEGVRIGSHVWIGERAYLTKGASISDNSVVGACSVVTRAFQEPHVAIAGNPARVIRKGLRWFRNFHELEPNSKYARALEQFTSRFQ